MTKKSILIFGGGINQLTLIEVCNDLGFKSIVIDPSLHAVGRNIAHRFYRIDANDYQATKQIAEENNITGIATSQMENPLRLMAKLAQEKGYIFNSPEIIEQSLNKYQMKKVLGENNVPVAKYKYFKNKSKLSKKSIEDFNYPLIIKPVDAHSSRGVFRIEKFTDISKFIDITVSFSKQGDFLIEEFIEGKEYSIEAVTFNKKTTIVQFTEKIITPFPEVVEMGHIQPAELTEEHKKAIAQVVGNAIDSLNLDNTVTHTEIKLSPNGPVVIEVGPRMGGDFISSYLTKNSCGVDLDKATILMSVGIEPELKQTDKNFTFVKYFSLPVGTKIVSIGNFKKLEENDDVVFTHFFLNKGDMVHKVTHSAQRSGVVIVTASNKKQVIQKAEYYTNKFISLIKTKKI